MKICLFDPGLENNSGLPSANLGDLIIQEAVKREISSLFENCEIVHISTHNFPTQEHIDLARSCSLIFVGGTNLLESKMNEPRLMWKIGLRHKIKLGRAVLLGVGWRHYQEKPNLYTKISLNSVLSNKLLHSVRDNYAKTQLQNAGIKNVINTGCPTMWPLMDIKSDQIPQEKSDTALVMFTDYRENPELDGKLLEIVLSKYKKVFIWPQGRRDMQYIWSLLSNKDFPVTMLCESAMQHIDNLVHDTRFPVIMLDHSIVAFEKFLNSNISFDYIGTRLHGGVKCLLSRKRALILEVDNRAKEIARETGLPTSTRSNFSYINQWIEQPYITNIKIDVDAINSWKSQFTKFGVKEVLKDKALSTV